MDATAYGYFATSPARWSQLKKEARDRQAADLRAWGKFEALGTYAAGFNSEDREPINISLAVSEAMHASHDGRPTRKLRVVSAQDEVISDLCCRTEGNTSVIELPGLYDDLIQCIEYVAIIRIAVVGADLARPVRVSIELQKPAVNDHSFSGDKIHFKRRHYEQLAASVIDKYVQALASDRRRSVIRDAYDNFDQSKWIAKLDDFIDKVIHRDVTSYNVHRLTPLNDDQLRYNLYSAVNHRIDSWEETQPLSHLIDDVGDGIGYELRCKTLLEVAGWRVITTPKTGDQGADLLAEKGSRRLVVQCKLYSQPVGNKAVQEVIAARTFYQANEAFVVTNAPFTPSAVQLAQVCDVKLLHHSNLTQT